MKTTSLITSVLRLALMSLCIALLFGFSPLIVGGVLAIFSLTIPTPDKSACGLVMEVWAKYLMNRFWKDNGFLKFVYDDSDYVLDGRIVHIPQPGSLPNIVVNRSTFPATAVRRTDTEVLYSLDEYTTDPTHIPNIDKINLSYSKQDSVMGDHMASLDEFAADNLLLKWAANSTNYITTGDSIVNGSHTALTVTGTGGQTGTRYAFTHRDLKNLMTIYNVNKVPKQDRYCMIDDNMFDAFYDTLGETNAKDFSRYMDAANGVIGKLHTFNIMTRSSIMLATSGNTIKAYGASIAATDNLVSFAWQKNSIAMALGDMKMFQDLANPLYYGDINSALVMCGGRVRRGDGLGATRIIQGTAS